MTNKIPPTFESTLADLISRRDFIKLFGQGATYTAFASLLPACGSSSGGDKDEMDEPPAIPAAAREYTVLKRTSFGVHRDALDAINNLGIDAYLDQQLNLSPTVDSDLENTIASLFPITQQSAEQLLVGFPDNIFTIALQMIGATQYRQIFSQRQLFEVMVEFWSDHFNIHLVNGLGPTLKPVDDREVIRRHALGNFKDLLHASAKSPAMLFYLDNFFNLSSSPNENYARELMELHTLGEGGGYSEFDVKEVARCFTGWTFHFPDDTGNEYGTFVYVDAIHDDDPKLVLGESITESGPFDAERVLDLLAEHPSTANYIATKLCRRFISDDPEQVAIEAVASAFMDSAGDIKQTLNALFATSAFQQSADLKFTRPSEYLAGVIRALAPDSSYPSDNGELFYFAQSIMGQLPFYWPTPDGYPDEQSYWASTGGLLNRWRLSFLSLASFLPDLSGIIDIDYTNMLNGSDTPVTIVDALTNNFLMRPLSAPDRDLLIDWIMETYNKQRDESLSSEEMVIVPPLISAVMLSSSYFQLR